MDFFGKLILTYNTFIIMNVLDNSLEELTLYYDNILNMFKISCSNDEPTPIKCIEEMIEKIPKELWHRDYLKILDPCCGNGNFSIPVFFKLKKQTSVKNILENILVFNDTNKDRLDNVDKTFCSDKFKLQISDCDFIKYNSEQKYDLIMANPPYAKFLPNGKRASKNHNLIKDFLKKSMELLKPDGYLLFLTPDNWMSLSDRNTLISQITLLQIVHLDIHNAKKYFKKIGSSFTWYIIQNRPFYKNISVSGIWKKNVYTSSVISQQRNYIPLLYNDVIQSILSKTIDCKNLPKFKIQTSSDLHRYTKSNLISNEKTEEFKYKIVHTPSQTVWASRSHKYQNGVKVFISLTDKYKVFIEEDCGMTQSIAFILCENIIQAEIYKSILEHPLYKFINDITRYGNFNCIRILQSFPKPGIGIGIDIDYTNSVYDYFNITKKEIIYIQDHN